MILKHTLPLYSCHRNSNTVLCCDNLDLLLGHGLISSLMPFTDLPGRPILCSVFFSLQMACRSHVLRTWLSLTSHNVMMLYLQHHGSIIWTSFFAMCHWKLNCSGTESRNKPWIPEVRGQISTLHSSFSHIFFPHSPVQRLQDNFVLCCTEDLLDYINTFPQYTGHSSIFGSVYGVIGQINAQVHTSAPGESIITQIG